MTHPTDRTIRPSPEQTVVIAADAKRRRYAGLALEPLGRWTARTLQQTVGIALFRYRASETRGRQADG